MEKQAARIAELELQLAKALKDSSTSSKPPSSDIAKPKPKKKPGRPKKPQVLDERDDSERVEFTNLLYRALEQVQNEFEQKSWQAFWRCTIDNRAVASVAAELDISNSAVRQYRCRVLRRLRQQLGEQD